MISSTPAATASSTIYCNVGLSTSGSISFGTTLLAGNTRVPSPATGSTALRICMNPPSLFPDFKCSGISYGCRTVHILGDCGTQVNQNDGGCVRPFLAQNMTYPVRRWCTNTDCNRWQAI